MKFLLLFGIFFSSSAYADLFALYNSVPREGLRILGHDSPFRREHPEVVLLFNQFDGVGTGLFIESRVLVTSFHMLEGSNKGWEHERIPLAFQDPETFELIPIEKILALDPKHDLAFLQPVEGYHHSDFYSLDIPENTYTSSSVRIIGFPDIRFHILHGNINEDQSSAPLIKAQLHLMQLEWEEVIGISGGSVLFEDGKLAGVASNIVPEPEGQISLLFTTTEKIKDLMTPEKRLSCYSYTCIEEALRKLEFEAENDGDAETYFAMGYLLEMGIKFPNNTHSSFHWFKKAAYLGHGHAQSNLDTIIDRIMNSEREQE